MSTNLVKGDKKKSLLTLKEKLLQEIKYYEQRINESKNITHKSTVIEHDASSDSDSELLIQDSGPAVSVLKTQQNMLKTCLQATQELTGLEVLQSEVNVMVQDPELNGETLMTEPGVWREVTVECCMDLVPFSITFYAYRAHCKFAPLVYRGLRVLPLKTAHEVELKKSVLPGLKRPGDAVEVLRSYAAAYRSRRSTLARLADKFGARLSMEPIADGGYLLKCANLLEVSWKLQNKWSPIAPFHHKMKFDLEYMDESYIKIITAAHRQLSDPAVDTDERTLLLAKIISTCLLAAPDSGAPDSSDQEGPEKVKDSEVMAPPKSLPKKVRPKSSEHSYSKIPVQKPTKRSIKDDNNGNTVKKSKLNKETSNKIGKENKNIDEGNTEQTEKSVKSVAHSKKIEKNGNFKSNSKVSVASKINEKNSESVINVQTSETAHNNQKENIETKRSTNKIDSEIKGVKTTKTREVSKNNSEKVVKKSVTSKNVTEKQESVASTKNNAKNTETVKNKVINKDSTDKVTKTDKSDKQLEEMMKAVKNVASDKNVAMKTKQDKASVAKDKNELPKHLKSDDATKTTKKTENVLKKPSSNTVLNKLKKPLDENKNNNPTKITNEMKGPQLPKKTTTSTNIKKVISTGNNEKENSGQVKTKIPLKKVVTPKGVFKKMPVRASPRNPVLKTKSPLVGKKVIKKPVTAIPRLMSKPQPKVT